ncbi:MAG TPA: BTAD domain-containing putative transcriptional regulator [Gemmatimonadales bacterium]|jgi:DNA-binding SARP family transcriptional activator/TolB-like protein|nr:BTAD domain-containing putative transcriptional regulator [Gemmatimonadales bacterium]
MIEGIRLRTLGTLSLAGSDKQGLKALVSQPKRAVLLVYLAVARPKGLHRRDTLLALLWPDSDQARARHALSQLVYQLRRTLGAEAIVSEGDEAMGVAQERVWCDVHAFDAAVEERRWADALELYHGDFLTGVHLADAAPELEDWIGTERTRLRRAAANAAWTLALEEERAENGAAAAHWGRRAAALLPDDETAVKKLVALLGRLGDRLGALRVYDEFARRVQDEFGVEPGPELRGMAEELRRTLPSAAPREALPPAAPASVPSRPGRQAPLRSLTIVAALAGVIALTGAAIGLARLLSRSNVPVLAVGAITDLRRGDSAAPAPVVTDLLSTSLARLPRVQVVATPRLYELQSQLEASTHAPSTPYQAARAAGARELIQGSLHAAATGGVLLDLQRIDLATGDVRKGYRAEGRDIFAVVDAATVAIAQDLGAPAPDEPVADVTTHSLIAYRFYEEGLRAYYQNDGSAAQRLFRSALEEDSTFAMAAFWLGKAARARGFAYEAYYERAARLADRATDRERLIIRQAVTESALDPAAAAIAETLAVRYPLDPDAQLALSGVRQTTGDFLGALAPLRRVITADSLSLKSAVGACRACDAYAALIGVYVWADSFPAAERTAREWIGRQPSSVNAWASLTLVFELLGDSPHTLSAVHTTDSLALHVGSDAIFRARLALRRGELDDANRRLRALIDEGAAGDPDWFLAITLRNQGRLREAAALAITRATVLRPVVLFEQGHFQAAAAAFEALANTRIAAPGHAAKNRAFHLTHTATTLAASGDTSRLAALADTVAATAGRSLFGREALLPHYIRGLLLSARHQPAAAVEEYRKAVFSWTQGYTRVNYELAKALLAVRRPRDAIAALQPAFRGSLEAANLYITRTELHELLAQAFDAAGERDSAIVHWRAVESAWRNADPPFRARWEIARQRALR